MTVTTAAMMPRRMRQQMSTHSFFHRALHASLFAWAPMQELNQLKENRLLFAHANMSYEVMCAASSLMKNRNQETK
jgi:hypothetical protein